MSNSYGYKNVSSDKKQDGTRLLKGVGEEEMSDRASVEDKTGVSNTLKRSIFPLSSGKLITTELLDLLSPLKGAFANLVFKLSKPRENVWYFPLCKFFAKEVLSEDFSFVFFHRLD